MGLCLSKELEEDRYSSAYKYIPYDWLGENDKEETVENKPIEQPITNIAIVISPPNQSEDRNSVSLSAKPHETNNSINNNYVAAKQHETNNSINNIYIAAKPHETSNSINNIYISVNMGQCTSAQHRGRSNSIEEAPYTKRKERKEPYRYRGRYEPYEWDIYVDEKTYNRPRDRARSFNSLRWDIYAEPERERSNSEVIPRRKKRESSPDVSNDTGHVVDNGDGADKNTRPNGVIPRSTDRSGSEQPTHNGVETQFSGEFYPESQESPILAKRREPVTNNPRRHSLDEPRDRKLSETEEPARKFIPEKEDVSRNSPAERERRQGMPQQIVVRKVESPEKSTEVESEPFRRRDVENKLANKPVVGTSPSDAKNPVVVRTLSDDRYFEPVKGVNNGTENKPRKPVPEQDDEPKRLTDDAREQTLRKDAEANGESLESTDDESEIMEDAEKRDAPPDYRDVVPRTTSVITYRNSPVTVHTIMSDKNRDKGKEKPKSDKYEQPKYSNLPLSATTEPIDKTNDKASAKDPAKSGKHKQINGPISVNGELTDKPVNNKGKYKDKSEIQPKSNDKPLYTNVPESVYETPKRGDNEKQKQEKSPNGGDGPIYSNGPLSEQKDTTKDKDVDKVTKKSDEQKKPANTVVTPKLMNGNIPKLNGIVNSYKPIVARSAKEKEPIETNDLVSPRQPTCDNLGTRPEKDAVKETVLIPNKFPQLFTGKRHAWRGLLLFGPAGSGKASLATAVAKEIGHSYSTLQSFITFNSFNGNAVSAMFKKARDNTPHVIIIDHLDGLSAAELRELHKQMSLSSEEQFEGLLVVGISDSPWLLDKYIVELFEKRIFITLPSAASRAELFRENLEQSQHNLTEDDFIELGAWSEGYTCADIITVVNETLMRSMRKIQHATYFKKITVTDIDSSHQTDMYTPCSPGEEGAIEMNWTRVPEKKLQEPVIRLSDVLVALRTQKPSLNPEDVEKHKQFAKKFTQHGSNNNTTHTQIY